MKTIVYEKYGPPEVLQFKEVASYYSAGMLLQFLSLERFYWQYYPVIFVLGLSVTLVAARSLRRSEPDTTPDARLVRACAIYLLLSFASFVMGPHSDGHRYTVHILAVLALCSALCSVQVGAVLPLRSAGRWTLAGAVLLFGCYHALLSLRDTSRWMIKDAGHQVARKRLGRWIRDHVPHDQRIISADLGAIAYEALDHQFVDALGLTTAKTLEAARSGEWAKLLDWLAETKPTYAADTVYGGGDIYALSILRQPWKYFTTVQPPLDDATQNGDALAVHTTTLLDLTVRSLGYRVARLQWDDAVRPAAMPADGT